MSRSPEIEAFLLQEGMSKKSSAAYADQLENYPSVKREILRTMASPDYRSRLTFKEFSCSKLVEELGYSPGGALVAIMLLMEDYTTHSELLVGKKDIVR